MLTYYYAIADIVKRAINCVQNTINEIKSQLNRESLNLLDICFMQPSTDVVVKLPKINILKFNGTIENFQEFEMLFQNIVHEECSITKVRKLYYLKEALIGDAAEILRDMPITETAYDES